MYFIFFAMLVLLGLSQPVQASPVVAAQAPKTQIRILPVAKTPESDSIVLVIAIPRPGDVVQKNPVWIQFRVDGYALGADSSQFERSKEIAVSDMGQTVHVVIDNDPYFPINEPAINPFNEEGYFHNTSYKFQVPYSLKEGSHTIRIFPARSYGESLKGSNTLFTTVFQLGPKDTPFYGNDLSKPYLTYNEPSDQFSLRSDRPILLDFLVTNCELSPDGYKVRLTIDGQMIQMLTSLQPYYIYGLAKGKHTIQLELLDPKGNLVPGSFNNTQRVISVQ